MKSETSMHRHIAALQRKVQLLENENRELKRELAAMDAQYDVTAQELRHLKYEMAGGMRR